jgi:hypothetical protein
MNDVCGERLQFHDHNQMSPLISISGKTNVPIGVSFESNKNTDSTYIDMKWEPGKQMRSRQHINKYETIYKHCVQRACKGSFIVYCLVRQTQNVRNCPQRTLLLIDRSRRSTFLLSIRYLSKRDGDYS